MTTMPIELYTDGSCLRNPGAGGLAYIIRYWEVKGDTDLPEPKVIEGNQGFRLTTNNRMEIMAGIYGLNFIIDQINSGTFSGATQINLTSDSEYFCNAINQKWINKWMENNWMTSGFKGSQPKPVKNKDLWEQVIEIENSGDVLTPLKHLIDQKIFNKLNEFEKQKYVLKLSNRFLKIKKQLAEEEV